MGAASAVFPKVQRMSTLIRYKDDLYHVRCAVVTDYSL